MWFRLSVTAVLPREPNDRIGSEGGETLPMPSLWFVRWFGELSLLFNLFISRRCRMARLPSLMMFRWSSGSSWPWRRLAFHNFCSTAIVRFYCVRSRVQILVFADHVQDEHGEMDFGPLQQGWVYTKTICQGTPWISIFPTIYHAFEIFKLNRLH